MVVTDNATANGAATNSVKATVTDANGNLLQNQTVSFSADNGASFPLSAQTNALGVVTVSGTSNTAGKSTVTASLNGVTISVDVNFAAPVVLSNVSYGNKNPVYNSGYTAMSCSGYIRDVNGVPLANRTVTVSMYSSGVFNETKTVISSSSGTVSANTADYYVGGGATNNNTGYCSFSVSGGGAAGSLSMSGWTYKP